MFKPKELRMDLLKALILIFFSGIGFQAAAADIGFGTVKGIKVFDFSNRKVTKIYFSEDAIRRTESQCNGVADITHILHDEATAQKMISVALSAYMAGKKIRAYSETSGSCEASLISVQETYF
jgi:hypothetical protein